MIAIAMVSSPELLIADEPTTALDVTVQAQILDLMKHFNKTLNTSIIFITHDFGVVADLADPWASRSGPSPMSRPCRTTAAARQSVAASECPRSKGLKRKWLVTPAP